jgi:hypothetical protein
MTAERIPARWVYQCDRCLDRQTFSESEDVPDDHRIRQWVTISIVPLLPATATKGKYYREAHLCGRCVNALGSPLTQDEAPPPARGDGA